MNLVKSPILGDVLELGGNNTLAQSIKFISTHVDLTKWYAACDVPSPPDPTKLRKLSVVLDPEAKSRIIAIFDY